MRNTSLNAFLVTILKFPLTPIILADRLQLMCKFIAIILLLTAKRHIAAIFGELGCVQRERPSSAWFPTTSILPAKTSYHGGEICVAQRRGGVNHCFTGYRPTSSYRHVLLRDSTATSRPLRTSNVVALAIASLYCSMRKSTDSLFTVSVVPTKLHLNEWTADKAKQLMVVGNRHICTLLCMQRNMYLLKIGFSRITQAKLNISG